jgi:hypothetical protein
MFEAKLIGQSLESLVTKATFEATDRAMAKIVRDTQRLMLDTAKAATPSRTGAVRDSWLATPIWPHGPERYEGRIQNSHWLAHLLNYGTEAHDVGPEHKKAIIEAEGPRARAHVRGIQPHHMIEKAALVAESTLQERTLPTRETWKLDVEGAIEIAKKDIR